MNFIVSDQLNNSK